MAANGQKVGVIHTPDFLVLTDSEAGWVECKPEERLQELAAIQPNRYRHDEQARWRCPPGDEAGAKMGFFYRIWTPAETHPTVLRNIRYLEDYLFPDYPEIPDERKAPILEVVKREPGISLAQLIRKGADGKFDDVYALIGKQSLYIDYKEAPLSQPDRVRVFLDEQAALIAKVAAMSLNGGASHASVSTSDPASGGQVLDIRPKLECPTAEAEAILRRATSEELAEANLRYLIISGRAPVNQIKGSWQSQYRWRRAFREAEERLGCGLVGLLTKYRNCGRKPGYPKEIMDIADQMITEHFFGVKSKSKIATYGMIALACERRGLPVPSLEWVRRRISQLFSQQRITMRHRASEPLISEERIITLGDSLHGERP